MSRLLMCKSTVTSHSGLANMAKSGATGVARNYNCGPKDNQV